MSTNTELRSLFSLQGQVAIVTGGSRGLGLQIAEALGEFGAALVLAARKSDELSETTNRLEAAGIHAKYITADLSDPSSATRIVDFALDAFGRVDILVNNAGTTWGAPTEDHPLDAWQKVLETNLTGPFRLCQEVGKRAMIPAGSGSIVNIASIEGLQGHHPDMVPTLSYNVTKGAMVNFTRALAAEWGKYGIRVNALAPGYFPSKMTAQTLSVHEAQLVRSTPLGKLGGQADLKGPALLLASKAGGHITGQIVVVDGGAIVI